MSNLQGIITAIVTPFTVTGELNIAPLHAFLDFQRECGIDGVVVSGTTGEGPSLSVNERKLLLEAVMHHKSGLAVVAGTGAASVADAVELIRHAGDVGADGALVLPPFYFKDPSAQGLIAYYRLVLDAATIPVLLYNIPQFSAVAITNEVIDALIGHPQFVGLKDSAGDWARTHELITKYPSLRVYPGSDPLLARSLAAGAIGAITGITNALPDLMVAVYRAHQAGNDPAPLQARVDAACAIMSEYPLIAVHKSLLKLRRIGPTWVRPPLVDLSEEQESELADKLKEVGIDYK